MNTVVGMLSPLDVRDLRAVVRGLCADSDVGQSVMWYTPDARSYDPARGAVVNSETSSTFTAWVGPAEVDEDSGILAGDIEALILTTDVAAPMVNDRFSVGGVPHYVVKVVPSPISAMHAQVFARRVP